MKIKYLKTLDRYFNGEMPEAEKAEFENALKTDTDLYQAYREYHKIIEAIGDQDTLDLRTKLRETREESKRSGHGRTFLDQGNTWIWLAAMLIIIVCFTFVTSLLVEEIQITRQYSNIGKTEVITGLARLDKELLKYGIRNDELTLSAPIIPCILDKNEDLYIEWKVDPSFSLVLELINGSGKVVYRSRKNVQSPYVVNKRLSAGFYVFRIRDKKDAFYQGIIYLQ